MEVDSSSEETAPPPAVAEPGTAPSVVVVPQAKLKRSSSAPLLVGSPSSGGHSGSVLSGSGSVWTATSSPSSGGASGGCGSLSPSASPASPVLISHSAFHPAQSFREGLRGRTMSVTSSGPHSPVVPRVHQIRAEEMEAVTVREAQQERELASKLLISQSWDDLSIDETPSSCASPSPSSPVLGGPRRLHSPPIFGCPSPSGSTSCATAGAASPSGSNRQCYSPSVLRSAMRAPSSPSPTRVQRHRSQSPQLVLRPSALGAVKRKLSSDSDGAGSVGSGEPVERAKRMLTLDDTTGKDNTLLLQVAPTDGHS